MEKLHRTPVGAVAAAISACFFIIALSIFCYRYHVQRVINGQYMETNVRMSQLDQVEDIEPHLESSPAIAQNVLAGAFENAVVVSPYRLNPGYRRPPGGDSDHGYSTMTPHEESEQAGPSANVEPLVSLSDGPKNNPANSSPIHTSPMKDCPSLTKLPKSSSFLAQVQVHEVDTH